MEVCSQPGMASDSPGDVSNKMIKVQNAGLGFRVKSGWAAVVLLTDTAHSPQLSDVSRIELCDPRLPETRQPYHAAMGELETEPTKLNQREHVVRSISQQSLARLLKDYRRKGFRITRAALVGEAKSIRLRSQIPTYARMPLKAGYFGQWWSKACRSMRFALRFSSNATLTPTSLRD